MLNSRPRVVFFDVDGVLVDSLPQHLSICADQARESGLSLQIPDAREFRRMVATGVRVSPMAEMYRALGFPAALVPSLVARYDEVFAQAYPTTLFPGVPGLLAGLAGAGLTLGIVTANSRQNVLRMLGGSMAHFDERWCWFADTIPDGAGKAWCLEQAGQHLARDPATRVFVGDQPADAAAARKADWRFIGVTYGWGIPAGSHPFPAADSVAEIAEALTPGPSQR